MPIHSNRFLFKLIKPLVENGLLATVRGRRLPLLDLAHGLGLREHLTPQRSNGLRSMVQRIRSEAQAVAA